MTLLLWLSPARVKAVKVAVCLAGHARSFPRGHVYASIQKQFIGELRRSVDKLDILAVIPTGDAEAKLASGYVLPSIPSNETAIWTALALLQPRMVTRPAATSSMARVNSRCQTDGYLNYPISRVLGQLVQWQMCYEQVLAAEAQDGQSYDWVIRSRPDAWWYAPHPFVCLGNNQTCPFVYSSIHSDHHFMMPRGVAHIMRDILQRDYASCTGPFPHDNLEAWLRHTLRAAAASLNIDVHAVQFPFVLVRDKRTDVAAIKACAYHPTPRQCLDLAYPPE